MKLILTTLLGISAASASNIFGRLNAWDELQRTSDFSKFCQLVSNFPSYVQQLKQENADLTVFIPTNQAMMDAKDFLSSLDKSDLGKLIGYHFVTGMGQCGIPEFETGKLMSTEYCPNSLLSQPQMLEVYKDRKTHQVWVGNDLNIARIVKGNIACSNAMMHGVSHVLVPPENVVATARRFPSTFPHAMSTWIKALEFTGLDGKLASATGVTVLVPSDQAFARLGKNTLGYLFSNQGRHLLRQIVEYHIIMKTDYEGQIPLGSHRIATALQGKSIEVEKCDSGITINEKATVIYADILCSNGVMHLLDSVLLPFSIPK